MSFIKSVKPRIGIMAIGLKNYWSQFKGMKQTILHSHKKLVSLFLDKGELVEVGLVDDVFSSHEAGTRFIENNVDIVFVHLTTYANSETLLPAVRNINVPIVLLNVQPVRALNMKDVKNLDDWLGVGVTPAALPEMTNVLIRIKKQFDMITGHLENDEILERDLDIWCKLARLLRRLKTQSLALLGRPFAGMMDLNIDETKLFSKFGTFIHHFEWDDIINEISSIPSPEQEKGIEILKSTFPLSDSLTKQEFQNAANILIGMQRFVYKNNLCSISSHYEGTPSKAHAELLSAINPALSVLNSYGIACSVEGDMKVAFAMLILKTIAGSATLAELYGMDFNDDIVFIGHSGAGDPAISKNPASLSMSDVFHGKSGRGYLTQFFPSEGDITLLSITQDSDGDFRMIASEGEIVEGHILQLGDTNCRVRFPQGLRNFIRDWSSFGPTHHGALGYGRHLEDLKRVAIAMDIPLYIV